MNRLRLLALISLGTALTLPLALRAPARADDPSGKPSPTEAAFVHDVSADLAARFPTPADAEKAGFLRYTDEDDTGAISYANRVWTSSDARHPSQLWYDAKGRLIGADFSVPYTDAPPHLFGVDPARWTRFGLHDHYGLAGPNGTTIYGATSAKKVASVGGNPTAPTATNLVALGIAKAPSDVRFVFAFPNIWDLSLWVIPNANGAFADKNPAVKPVNPPKPEM
jgi:hypothetical protein